MSDQNEGHDSAADRLTDVIDIASARESQDRDDAIYAARLRTKQQQLPLSNGSYEFTDCEECGNEIGLGRLKVAAQNLMCVYCASAKEKRK